MFEEGAALYHFDAFQITANQGIAMAGHLHRFRLLRVTNLLAMGSRRLRQDVFDDFAMHIR